MMPKQPKRIRLPVMLCNEAQVAKDKIAIMAEENKRRCQKQTGCPMHWYHPDRKVVAFILAIVSVVGHAKMERMLRRLAQPSVDAYPYHWIAAGPGGAAPRKPGMACV